VWQPDEAGTVYRPAPGGWVTGAILNRDSSDISATLEMPDWGEISVISGISFNSAKIQP